MHNISRSFAVSGRDCGTHATEYKIVGPKPLRLPSPSQIKLQPLSTNRQWRRNASARPIPRSSAPNASTPTTTSPMGPTTSAPAVLSSPSFPPRCPDGRPRFPPNPPPPLCHWKPQRRRLASRPGLRQFVPVPARLPRSRARPFGHRRKRQWEHCRRHGVLN